MRKVSVEKWCYVRHYVHPSDASPLPNPTITVLGLASFWEETRPSSVRPSVGVDIGKGNASLVKLETMDSYCSRPGTSRAIPVVVGILTI